MKKIDHKILLTMVVVGVMTVGLVACSPASSSSTSTSSDPGATDTSVYDSYTFTGHDQLVSDTAYLEEELGYNPHGPRPSATETFNPEAAGHFDNIDNCQLCHSAGDNGESMLWCTTCHIGMEMPEGWQAYPTTPADSDQITEND